MKNFIPNTLIFLLLLLSAGFPISAQTITEESITTDTVDIFKHTEETTKKSSTLAMVSSVLLPGLGHEYLGMRNRALIYFTAEALFICGAVFSEQYSKRLNANSQVYALQYAGVMGIGNLDDAYWQNVGNFLDSKGYNAAMELNRQPDKKYVLPEQQWNWIDESLMKQYQQYREHATAFHVASTFFIGAMVLDRIVAFVDARATTKFGKVRKSAGLSITPTFSLAYPSAGMCITKSF